MDADAAGPRTRGRLPARPGKRPVAPGEGTSGAAGGARQGRTTRRGRPARSSQGGDGVRRGPVRRRWHPRGAPRAPGGPPAGAGMSLRARSGAFAEPCTVESRRRRQGLLRAPSARARTGASIPGPRGPRGRARGIARGPAERAIPVSAAGAPGRGARTRRSEAASRARTRRRHALPRVPHPASRRRRRRDTGERQPPQRGRGGASVSRAP